MSDCPTGLTNFDSTAGLYNDHDDSDDFFFTGNVRCRQVVLDELITVCPEKSLSHSSTPKSAKKKLAQPNHDTHLYVEMQPIHPVSFSVYVLKRTTNYKWRKKKVTFFCGSGNERLCEVWVSKIKAAISDKSKLT